ncbi:MAG TPA: PepSY domain-containing protein [Terracidiphilus sp.]|jgi:hypothetical protein
MSSLRVMQWLRLCHLYLGIFTAPAILFFAFSGALQTLSLNDRSPDGSYTPPHWISVMAQLHKKQSTQLPQRRPGSPESAPRPRKTALDEAKPDGKAAGAAQPNPPVAPKPQQPAFQPPRKPLGMQVFFLLVCASLFASTISGAWMAWKFRRGRMAMAVVLAAGVAIPFVLLML